MNNEVRVRFAPSPTGYLHVGGARTALFNYLFARHTGGKFLLRIEDTDRSRFQENALGEIYASLQWLGLNWDEGPNVGGECGPFFQSERLENYIKYANQLIGDGKAYRCFCTPQRLKKNREEQEKKKLPQVSGYDRHCRSLSAQDEKKLLEENTPYVVRLKIPDGEVIVFEDMIRGSIKYQSDTLDDLVLIKSDGFPTYHLANVVDDHLMGITHVLRGDEWIASTPRHVILYDALGWEKPFFAHLPVILAEGGGKLSKRKGAASVMDYKDAGYLPDALLNFLSLLGWNPGDDREIMTVEELISAFSLKRVSPKSSVFDEKKLEWMNGMYMQNISIDRIIDDVLTGWKAQGLIDASASCSDKKLRAIVDLMKSRAKKVSDIAESTAYFFRDPQEYDKKTAKKRFKGDAINIIKEITSELENIDNFTEANIEDCFRIYVEKNEISGGKLIHPTRLAVSGVGFGPGLFELLALLGKDTVIRRMNVAIDWIEKRASGVN